MLCCIVECAIESFSLLVGSFIQPPEFIGNRFNEIEFVLSPACNKIETWDCPQEIQHVFRRSNAMLDVKRTRCPSYASNVPQHPLKMLQRHVDIHILVHLQTCLQQHSVEMTRSHGVWRSHLLRAPGVAASHSHLQVPREVQGGPPPQCLREHSVFREVRDDVCSVERVLSRLACQRTAKEQSGAKYTGGQQPASRRPKKGWEAKEMYCKKK
ncbi:hypothetical protein EDB86DRAFT_3014060 [Lactarius hatsudake]|nr:hypothetical protein EDB86DRAFT_3014060 [Lactarius hatsudake]